MASYCWCVSVPLDNGLVLTSHQSHTWTKCGTFCTVLMNYREITFADFVIYFKSLSGLFWNVYVLWISVKNYDRISVTPLWQNIWVTTNDFYSKYNIGHLWIQRYFLTERKWTPSVGVNSHLRISLYTGRAGSSLRPFEYELSFINST